MSPSVISPIHIIGCPAREDCSEPRTPQAHGPTTGASPRDSPWSVSVAGFEKAPLQDGTMTGKRLAALVGLRDRAGRVLQSQNEGWPDAIWVSHSEELHVVIKART